MDGAKFLNIILAIILPPLSVFLTRGFGSEFVIDIILTICIYFPGMLYALYLIFKTDQ